MAERSGPERLVYFVPYLNDAAVHRRLRMLRLGGLEQLLAVGFRRTPEPIAHIDGTPAIDLGRTEDGRLARRATSLAAALARRGSWGRAAGDASVVMARSLEALMLAKAYRARFAPRAPLVYESLDIHRTQLADHVLARGLRGLEARSLSRCSLLVTSSPAFVSEYFERLAADLPPVALLENKVLTTEIEPALLDRLRRDRATITVPPGPPWRIGWFGLLRCARSLELLATLCRQLPGQVEVVIRGKPAANLGDRLTTVAAATEDMTYLGPYDRASELATIHSDVHFCWTLDFSEAGANSDWLLPNRLYEAGAFGCVPLALDTVATGAWLASRGAGVLLSEPLDETLRGWAVGLSTESYQRARAALLRVPLSDFVYDGDDAAAFVGRLSALLASSPGGG